MLPYTTDPYRGKDAAKSEELRAFVARHGFPHTAGCLFSGAGGGFLMVVSEASVEGAMKMRINTDPVVLPYGSSTIEEARSAPKAGPPPSKPPRGASPPRGISTSTAGHSPTRRRMPANLPHKCGAALPLPVLA